MAEYSYIGVDSGGRKRKGRMEAPSRERVYSILKADGIYPLSIKELGFFSRDIKINIANPVKPRDLSVFSRQFSSIIRAGVPIVQALLMLAEQTENRTLRKAVVEIELMVERGERLSDAMRQHSKVFPSLMINMVEAGEVSGNLEVMFDRISVHYEKEAKLKAQIKKAMIYPAMLGVLSLGVIILMLAFVIPSFVSMFEDMNIQLPAITIIIMKISNFIRSKWYILLLVLIVLITAFVLFKNSQFGRSFLDRLALKIPIFGKLNVKTACARFTRVLSTLLASGINLMDAIELTAKVIDNVIIKRVLLSSKEDVARGVPLSSPLLASRIFPPMVYHMTRIGEETGSMEQMLSKVADYYDEEVELAASSLTAIIDPVILITLSLIIGTLLIAMLQPMFTMYDSMNTFIGY